MAKRSKKPADLNRLAAAIVDESTGEAGKPKVSDDPKARSGKKRPRASRAKP